MYKVRVGYHVHIQEDSDVDAVNVALVDIPDDARQVRVEVVRHWTEPEAPKPPIEEAPRHETQ